MTNEYLNPRTRDVPAKITEYLSNGGLFNPEQMDHEAVRDLLIHARDVIEIFERERSAGETSCDFAWVIELPNGMATGPTYWDGRGPDTFHYKHENAIRFARKEDAERALGWLVAQSRRDEGARVSEHGWYRDSAQKTPAESSGKIMKEPQ